MATPADSSGTTGRDDLAATAGVETLAGENTLFRRLRDRAGQTWLDYVDHAFVRDLGAGTLPHESFKHYLIQDYIFLMHYSRAYALAVYKADNLADMRAAGQAMSALLDHEMSLHIKYCAEWGIDEEAILATPEAKANMAYTRYVLERGLSGDALDLHVALLPCMVGYAEIANRILARAETRIDGNPYRAWIETYSGEDFQDLARAGVRQLDEMAARRGGDARFDSLLATFTEATRLEVGFWDMGYSRSW